MDLTLIERENLLMGQDFLTWLWYASESRDGIFRSGDGQAFTLYMENRISVQGGDGESLQTATVNAPGGAMDEARTGLRTGKKVHRALLKLEVDGETWQAQVKAEDFTLTGLKTPKMDTSDSDDNDPDAKFLEKIYLIERFMELFDVVFAEFLKVRLSSDWPEEARKVGNWIGRD